MAINESAPFLLPGVSLETILPPTPPDRYLSRPRLTKPLDQGAPKALIVMTPSGYGKTLLGAEWAAKTPQVAWYKATERDNLATVLNRMISSLRRSFPDFASWYEPSSVTINNLEETIKRVTRNISEIEDTVDFVFDNLEKMPPSNTPFVQIWANNAPLNVRTLSLRKNPPLLSYERAANLGVLHYFNAFDLTFSRDEIQSLAELYEVELPRNLAEILEVRMKGWPAGLALILEILSECGGGKAYDFERLSYTTKNKMVELVPGAKTTEFVTLESLITCLADQLLPGPISHKRKSITLTPAELKILVQLPSESTLVEIANNLHLSINTVKSHLKSIYQKIGADSRERAVLIAREMSLL